MYSVVVDIEASQIDGMDQWLVDEYYQSLVNDLILTLSQVKRNKVKFEIPTEPSRNKMRQLESIANRNLIEIEERLIGKMVQKKTKIMKNISKKNYNSLITKYFVDQVYKIMPYKNQVTALLNVINNHNQDSFIKKQNSNITNNTINNRSGFSQKDFPSETFITYEVEDEEEQYKIDDTVQSINIDSPIVKKTSIQSRMQLVKKGIQQQKRLSIFENMQARIALDQLSVSKNSLKSSSTNSSQSQISEDSHESEQTKQQQQQSNSNHQLQEESTDSGNKLKTSDYDDLKISQNISSDSHFSKLKSLEDKKQQQKQKLKEVNEFLKRINKEKKERQKKKIERERKKLKELMKKVNKKDPYWQQQKENKKIRIKKNLQKFKDRQKERQERNKMANQIIKELMEQKKLINEERELIQEMKENKYKIKQQKNLKQYRLKELVKFKKQYQQDMKERIQTLRKERLKENKRGKYRFKSMGNHKVHDNMTKTLKEYNQELRNKFKRRAQELSQKIKFCNNKKIPYDRVDFVETNKYPSHIYNTIKLSDLGQSTFNILKNTLNLPQQYKPQQQKNVFHFSQRFYEQKNIENNFNQVNNNHYQY